MVLELKVPHGASLDALRPLLPVFLSYVLSFVYVGIYWSNHHHLLHTATRVTGGMLWANLHFMFWLSLFPWATAWMGENEFAAIPSAVYGVVLLMAALSWMLLQAQIIRAQGNHSLLKRALGSDMKGRLSPLMYLGGIALSFVQPGLGLVFYVGVALIWLVPDKRIERALESEHK
jgi:uncharacterized membrane protein